MTNYKKNRKCFKSSDLGSLYINEKILGTNTQPVIYIGGQMEHRGHIIEQTGYSGDNNHEKFDGSWMYDYSIFTKNKNRINAKNFSDNLINSIREAKLSEVILVTNSHGGLIGGYATKHPEISKVISFHPPILGTPLANPQDLEKYKNIFTKQQRLLLKTLKLLINYDFGFEKDNYSGLDLSLVDLNKLLVVGNYVDINTEKNNLVLELYNMIEKITGYRNDGVVIFEPSEFAKNGINYLQTNKNASHFDSTNTEYVNEIIKRVLTK